MKLNLLVHPNPLPCRAEAEPPEAGFEVFHEELLERVALSKRRCDAPEHEVREPPLVGEVRGDHLEAGNEAKADSQQLKRELLEAVQLVGEDDELVVCVPRGQTVPFDALVQPLGVRRCTLASRVKTESICRSNRPVVSR